MGELPKGAKREIKNLLMVVFGGVFGAVLLAGALLHYHNPSGRYKAGNLLLDPDVLEKLKGAKTAPLEIEAIELLSYEDDGKQWKKSNVPLQSYGDFYRIVSQDLSMESSPDLNQFINPMKLQIKAKKKDESKVIQELEVQEAGGQYRIMVNDDWIYFQHQQIGQQADQLLKP